MLKLKSNITLISNDKVVTKGKNEALFLSPEAATGGALLKKGVLGNFAKFTGKHLCGLQL